MRVEVSIFLILILMILLGIYIYYIIRVKYKEAFQTQNISASTESQAQTVNLASINILPENTPLTHVDLSGVFNTPSGISLSNIDLSGSLPTLANFLESNTERTTVPIADAINDIPLQKNIFDNQRSVWVTQMEDARFKGNFADAVRYESMIEAMDEHTNNLGV